MARIATVFGATGLQGSSVVHALLQDGTFNPRAVTRDANSEAARKLADQGCQVVQADLGDKEAVKRAVTGAECVFLVTLPFTSVPEVTQGFNVVDASKEAGVKFVVFSTLPNMTELSHGKYIHGVHWDDKV
ncbi:NmrA-like domain-containing protein [Schizophyllum fasciatum]